ncbi:MAG: hypothetical protein HUU37_06085 [Bdellovibrionales bacterium]|nr:hypothetical protein [Bdellovibrionales bacterium]
MTKRLLLLSLFSAALAMAAEEYLSPSNIFAPGNAPRSPGGQWVPIGGFGGPGLGGVGGVTQWPGAPLPHGGVTGMDGDDIPDGAANPYQIPSYPGGYQPGYRPDWHEPPSAFDQKCVYSSVIRSLQQSTHQPMPPSGGMSNAGTPLDLRGSNVLHAQMDYELSQIDMAEKQENAAHQQQRSQVSARIRELEKEKAQINLTVSGSTPSPEIQARLIAIDRELIEQGAELSTLEDRALSRSYFFQSRRSALGRKETGIHPVLHSIYRNQGMLTKEGGLAPLAKDLISYLGLSVGGPAGLVIGSTLGTLFSGAIDSILAKAKEILSKPQPKMEELAGLLQEVCRWRNFNNSVATGLVDAALRTKRAEARGKVLQQLSDAEDKLNACALEVPMALSSVSELETILAVIQNRVKQGNLSVKSRWTEITGLNLPPQILEELRRKEDLSVSGLVQELTRMKLSRVQFARAYSRENVEINLGLLEQMRSATRASMGNLSPEDAEQLRMIMLASGNRLKVHEMELQRKLIAVMDTEKGAAIEELKRTYRDGTSSLTTEVAKVQLPYARVMRQLHERHKALEQESASLEAELLKELALESKRLEELQKESPLRVQADVVAVPVSNTPAAAPNPGVPERKSEGCSSAEVERGCREGSLFLWKFCSCPGV